MRAITIFSFIAFLLTATTVSSIAEISEVDRVTEGIQALYGFAEGEGAMVQDISGVGAPLDLEILDPGAVTWLPGGGLVLDSPVVITSAGPATKIIDACQTTQAVTVEAWIDPANTTQGGPSRIVAHSQDGNPNGGNFMLGQTGTGLEARLRTTSTDQYGMPGLLASDVLDGVLTHLVYTRDASGATALYVDGLLATSSSIDGTFADWGSGYA